MKRMIVLVLLIALAPNCFSQLAFTWGVDSKGESTRSLDLHPIGIVNDMQDMMFWDALLLSYEFKQDRASILFARGFTGIVQAMVAAGPEFRLDEGKEVGLQLKAGLSYFFMPLQLELTPRYNFRDESMSVNIGIEIGVGFYAPLMGKKKKVNSS